MFALSAYLRTLIGLPAVRAVAHALKQRWRAVERSHNARDVAESENKVMRRQFGSWIVAGVIALCTTPFLALAGPAVAPAAEAVAAAVPISADGAADSGFPEEAAMVLVGTALIGLASAVRRAH
jgi:hypothetical protein